MAALREHACDPRPELPPPAAEGLPLVGYDLAVAHGEHAIRKGAMSGSWVTTMMVTPCFAVERCQRLHDRAMCAIELPVGSSASSRLGGIVDQGRASATALLLAAGKLAGVLRSRSAGDGLQCHPRTFGARGRARRSGCGIEKRQATFLKRAGACSRLNSGTRSLGARCAAARDPFAEMCNVEAFEKVMPVRRPVETAENRHQRRLARS